MIAHMWKVSANLVDSSQQLPFYALVDYSRKEPETVREMFRKLYAEEKIDNSSKQQLINEFIASSEILRKKYYPESRLYVNNQRSVMMYLFLRYPNSNYGYKASQAKSFADCIEFYEDWGPMTDFNLEIFSRMCEQVIEEIKAKEDMNLLTEAKDYLTQAIKAGDSVSHKKFGEAIIEKCAGIVISVHFPAINETKKLGLTVAVANGLITLTDDSITQKIKEYVPVLNNESRISVMLSKLEDEIQPYLEYLD